MQSQDQDDVWFYSWGSAFYIPTKAYKQLIGTRQIHPSYNWLWKSSVQKKHKVFFCLLLKGRLSTRNILRRKNRVPPSYDCVLCQQQLEETLQHLFLSCPFTIGCWGFLHLAITTAEPFGALQSFKAQLDMDFFMDIIIILSWTIWMAHNDFIFKGSPHHLRKHKKGSKRNLF